MFLCNGLCSTIVWISKVSLASIFFANRMPWTKWCLCFPLVVRLSHYNVFQGSSLASIFTPTRCLGSNGVFVSVWLSDWVIIMFFKVVHLLQFSPPTQCLGSNSVFVSVWLSDWVIIMFFKVVHLLQFSLPARCLGSNVVFVSV